MRCITWKKKKYFKAFVFLMVFFFTVSGLSPGIGMVSAQTPIPADSSTDEFPNLINNPGFESGISTPDGWIFYSSYGGSLEMDTNQPYEGEKSVKLSIASTDKRSILGQSNIIIPENGIYRFTAYYRTQDITGEAPFIIIYRYDAQGNAIGNSGVVYCNKDVSEWTKLVYEEPFDETVHHVLIQLYFRQATGSVWFDSVELKKVVYNPGVIPSKATFNKSDINQNDISIILNLDELSLNSIKNGEMILASGEDYITSGQMLTIKKDYLTSLPVGITELSLSLSNNSDVKFPIEIIDVIPNEQSSVSNAGFENGSSLPYFWSFSNNETESIFVWDENEKYDGLKSIKLINQNSDDQMTVTHDSINVSEGKRYHTQVYYKTSSVSVPGMILNWYDVNGNLLQKDKVDGTTSPDWTLLSMDKYAPSRAFIVILQLESSQAEGTVWFDNIELNQILVDADGEVIPVSDVEDINEVMSPEEFWAKIPSCTLNAPIDSAWTQYAIRDFFFGITMGVEQQFAVNVPENTLLRDASLPVLNSTLGAPVDPDIPLAIAGDIEHRPFVKGHGGYSLKYYPRRMHDYLLQEYIPSYVLTGDTRFSDRANELLEFLKISQWTEQGTNEFTSTYCPSEYQVHPEWAGGWDYLFDWEWTDAYGYTWNLHEPDHHVNSQISAALINAYQIFNDPECLEMARKFVYYQVPRYGFHKGVWNNQVYYWTEYNPTGSSIGNPFTDATDNVVALVALSCAMVGNYESDPVLKAKYLEYARGLLWYMVREITTDGRFLYDGAENPLNWRKAISHDEACIIPGFITLTYLYKSGIDVSDLVDEFAFIEESYRNTWSVYQKKYYMKMFKIYDGIPAPNNKLTFSTFVNIVSEDLEEAQFKDTISEDFELPATINLRISKLLNPDSSNMDWRTDTNNDVVLSVTPEQLQTGVIIPFTLEKGYTYKISYDLTAKSTFVRENAVDFDSEIFAWELDSNNNAIFIRGTSGSVGDGINVYTLPLRMQTNVNSTNFLSFGAKILFPFADEVDTCLEETEAPLPVVYVHNDNWGKISANKYIYLTQSLTPVKYSSGQSLICDGYGKKGKLYLAQNENDFVEFEFNTYLPTRKYNIFTSYATANNRGIAQLLIDGKVQGTEYDLYTNSLYPIPVEGINQGVKRLTEGKHTLKFSVTGKNSLSSGYAIGIYDAIIFEPEKPFIPVIQ